MKLSFTISTLNYPDEVKSKLLNINSINIDENVNSDYTFFDIYIDSSGYCNLKKSLADIIAEIVLDNLEVNIVDDIIKHKYCQFNNEERKKIEQFTLDHLRKRDKLLQKINIISRLLQYLNKYKNLNIEGFVRFRLKDYVQQLKLAVDRAVDDLLVEKEYNEFIDLLKYFIDIQQPQIPLVHIIKDEDGKTFKILDDQENIIQTEYMEGYIAELMDGEVKYEDLLVSALINISPGEIILHFNDQEIENTIKNIFEDKVTVCSGCNICQNKEKNT